MSMTPSYMHCPNVSFTCYYSPISLSPIYYTFTPAGLLGSSLYVTGGPPRAFVTLCSLRVDAPAATTAAQAAHRGGVVEEAEVLSSCLTYN